jgi:tetratricopeptide (TPR) repeat protein
MSRTLVKKLAVLSLLAALLGGVSSNVYSQSRKDRKKAEQLIEEGDRAARQKNYQAAISSYAQALAILPNSAVAHYKKGEAHFFLGEYDQTVAEMDLALKNGQKPIEVWRVRWDALDKLKRYDEALADVNNILAADPGNQGFQLAAANINYNKGSYKEAADGYTNAAPKAQNSADIYYRLADAKSKLGDIDGQAAAAEEAIRRNTQFLADALLLLGRARYAQKRIPEAIDAFSRALTARPDKLESYRQLAELHRSQNQIDEAIKILEAGRRLNATNGEVYKDLALFYSLAEKNDEAIAAGKSATQLLPNDPVAHTRLCRAYYQAKKSELAISSCNAALRLVPEDGESLFYLGRASLDLRKSADAEKYFKRAITSLQAHTKVKPDDADGFYMLGNAYADLQQNANAIEAYKKTLELNPKFTKANFNIGVIQFNEKNKPGVMEQYNALLQTDKVLAEKLKALIDTM